MSKRVMHLVLQYLTCLIATLSLAFPIAAGAQLHSKVSEWESNLITLDLKHQPFDEIIAAFSKQIGHSIVADDEPDLPSTDIHLEGTAKQGMDKIAEAFDYNWKMNAQGIILMRKVFKNAHSLPQMNLPEMRQMARESLAVLSFVHCDPVPNLWGKQCKTLVSSLSTTQAQTLLNKKLLRLPDLTTDQANLLQQIIVNHAYSDVMDAWNILMQKLNVMPRSQITLKPLEHDKGFVLYYVWQIDKGANNGMNEGIPLQDILHILPPEKKQP